MPDAIVVGAGPNGLVAANTLADHGWDVVVVEQASEPGGALRSAPLTRDGFVHDVFSAFYPLAVASPVIRSLELERFGLRWRHAPTVIAHPGGDGEPVVLSRDVEATAASLDASRPGDGRAWLRMYRDWERIGDDVVDALLSPFPPLGPASKLAGTLRRDLLRFARFALLPVRRMAEEDFAGAGAAMLLAGNALHADLSPEMPLSGFFGWLLTCLGQQHGFPVPEGGAGRFAHALVRRLEHSGGQVRYGTRVTRVVIRDGKAVAVQTADGVELEARRAVVADVGAPDLYLRLVGEDHLPPQLVDDLRRFQYDNSTIKVDWALDGPVPWSADAPRHAGTLHIADGIDHLSDIAAALAGHRVPARPFLIAGQMTLADPTRSPTGTETAWAYTHVPRRIRSDEGGAITGRWDTTDTQAIAERVEARIEEHAPGFRQRILDRHVLTPPAMEAVNPNLVDGAINGGTAQLHQQLVFRPTPGLRTASTPVGQLYLASDSAHPGGGVHGACGANAAHAAMRDHRRPVPLFVAAAAAGLLARHRHAARSRSGTSA